MHQENSLDEWAWVLKEFGLADLVSIQDRYRKRRSLSQWEEKEKTKFAQIPKALMEQIYRRFYMDFLALGYSPGLAKVFLGLRE